MKKNVTISILVIIILSSVYLFFYIASRQRPVINLGEIYVRVLNFDPTRAIKSPLEITGEARGSWYFEGSFPIKIYDANGKIIGTAIAKANGDWMTEGFVPFETNLSFSVPTTATGEIVFKKDNPSGLQKNDAEFRIPIRFK